MMNTNSENQRMVTVSPMVQQFLSARHGMWINGESVESAGDRRLEVFNPATGQPVGSVADGTPADVDRAVLAARAAFRGWSQCRPAQRERLLLALADVVESYGEELAQIETINQGKSINLSRAVEVGSSVEYLRYMAGWATKIDGSTSDLSIPLPNGARSLGLTLRQPVGVVGAIVPWNFPLAIAIWKIASALACGCTIVVKPSEDTPLTALFLAKLTAEAGLPPGVVNVVTGKGSGAGAALAGHKGIDKVTFTGSTAVGKEIGRSALENMTRFTLELGGKNPMLVMDDVPTETILPGLMTGCFFNQGQVCAAASRIYILDNVFERTLSGIEKAIGAMTMGPGLDPLAAIQPLTSARHRARVAEAVNESVNEGAELVAGGQSPARSGYFFEPTLLIDHSRKSRLTSHEIFGPVIAAVRVHSLEEAISLANDTEYGLAASVWTNDLKNAMTAIREINAGTIWINSHIPLDPNLPFGGFKQSGIGREHGKGAVEQYTETKSVVLPT